MITVLTLDYSGFDDRARVSDLLAGLPELAVSPLLTGPTPHAVTACAYAEALLARLAGHGPVDVVIGYCMASPIAHEVARLVTTPGRRPPTLITLDGSPCPAEFVRQNYRTMLARYAMAEITPRVTATDTDLAEHASQVLADMADELTAVALRSLAADSGSVDDVVTALANDLVRTGVAWLTSLVAAHNATFPAWPGDVVSVMSREHLFAEPWPGAGTTTLVPVDCARAELLTHPDACRAITDALAVRSR